VEHYDGGATLTFPAAVTFNHVELAENLGMGQRITQHEVLAEGLAGDGAGGDGGGGAVLVEGKTVGNRRIHQLPVVTAKRLHVKLNGGGRLKSARVYTGALDAGVPMIPEGYEAPTDAPD